MSYLVYGSSGWIGSQIIELLSRYGKVVYCAKARLEEREHLKQELESIQPKYIINCAGLTGRPNVDWCEDHKQETIRVNVIGTLNLCDLAFIYKIHVTNFATGCIYQYDNEHPIGSKGFNEEEEPNFSDSFYSFTKAMVEKVTKYDISYQTLALQKLS